jgi:hypothetical protein
MILPVPSTRTRRALAALAVPALAAVLRGHCSSAHGREPRRGARGFQPRAPSCTPPTAPGALWERGARADGAGRPSVIWGGCAPGVPERSQPRGQTCGLQRSAVAGGGVRARPAGAPSREPFRTAADLER